jgi:hypothetical protein
VVNITSDCSIPEEIEFGTHERSTTDAVVSKNQIGINFHALGSRIHLNRAYLALFQQRYVNSHSLCATVDRNRVFLFCFSP